MNRPERLFTGLLVVALAGAGWAYYRAQGEQAATLQRIAALDACLVAANKRQAQVMQSSMASISYYVAENRQQAKDLWVQRQARRIQTNTQTLVDTLSSLRRRWSGSGTPAALVQLAAQFGRYTDTLSLSDAVSPRPFPPGWPVIDQAAVPELRHLAAPVAVAALNRLESQVVQLAARALVYKASTVGRSWDGFTKIGAYAIPVSNTVAPGGQYEAGLMLSKAASGLTPRMLVDGRKIRIDSRTSRGLVAFRMPPARPGQPDTVRMQWQGQLSTTHNGVDTIQHLVVPYFVVKHR